MAPRRPIARFAAWSYRKSRAVAHVSVPSRSIAAREGRRVGVADQLGLGVPGETFGRVGHRGPMVAASAEPTPGQAVSVSASGRR